MSKYLIINTTTFAASGPGSQSGKILVGGDNIISIVPNGSSGIRIVYQANVQTVLNFSGTIVVGDYSVITFITKEIERLQNGGSSTISLPRTFPNCFTTVGHPIGISSVEVIQPCCTP